MIYAINRKTKAHVSVPSIHDDPEWIHVGAEYVDAQVAQGLYEAPELAMQSIDPNNHDVFDICNAALTKARGES